MAIIPFSHNHHDQISTQRLSHEQRDSAGLRWPIRHVAEENGRKAYQNAYAQKVTSALGSNVVSIETHPSYSYHNEAAAAQPDTTGYGIPEQLEEAV